jgi:hypothetical protein
MCSVLLPMAYMWAGAHIPFNVGVCTHNKYTLLAYAKKRNGVLEREWHQLHGSILRVQCTWRLKKSENCGWWRCITI